MDVNGTHFHLVLGERDWQSLLAGDAEGLAWDAGSATVGLASSLKRFQPREGHSHLTPSQRRGAGRDRWGNTYFLGGDARHLYLQPAGTEEAGRMWSVDALFPPPSPATSDFKPQPEIPPGVLPTLRGLAVTGNHLLVVGTLDPGGLLTFDLHAGGRPTWRRWPDTVPDFRPFDLASAPEGGVLVLDGEPETGEPCRIWRLDRFFRVVHPVQAMGAPPPAASQAAARTPDFTPLDGDAGPLPGEHPARCSIAALLDSAWSLPTAAAAVAINSLSDGSILVLESDPALPFSRLHLLRDDHEPAVVSFESILSELLVEEAAPGETHLAGHDMVFLETCADPPDGELSVVDRRGLQIFVFALEATSQGLTLSPLQRHVPLRGFTGKALLKGQGEAFYDRGDRWVPAVEHPRRHYVQEGHLRGLVIDGGAPDIVWHRLLLDACLGDGTALHVESRAANREDLLDASSWHLEPAPYLRGDGSELPFHHPFPAPRGRAIGTWELLLQRARGRFLELRLTFESSGRTSPRLRALRVYAPRFSYLERYLPAAYGDDEASASFLERFLANLEGIFTALEGRIAFAQVLFDPRTAPAEALDWLAGWLGTVLDPEWDDTRRRLFLTHAHRLFRWRGTAAGLTAAIRLAIDPCPDDQIFAGLPSSAVSPPGPGAVRLVEHHRRRPRPAVPLGDPGETSGPRLVPQGTPWRPVDGAVDLQRRFQEFPESPQDARFSPLPPADPGARRTWQAVTQRRLPFPVAEVTPDDRRRYQAFLARRYRRIDLLNHAHGRAEDRTYTRFDAIELPHALPNNHAELTDWIHFVSRVEQLRRHAHRFTVLIPTRPGEDPQQVARRKARVEALVEREKPAHTTFDVQLFWALFQVGSARLGRDTQLGEGSRYVATVLGASHLGESFLAATPPWGLPDRTVLGRDPQGSEPTL